MTCHNQFHFSHAHIEPTIGLGVKEYNIGADFCVDKSRVYMARIILHCRIARGPDIPTAFPSPVRTWTFNCRFGDY